MDREELRKKLREKIKSKRNNSDSMSTLAKNVRNDPQSAFMQMGIDDPQILANAAAITKDPKQFLNKLSNMIDETSTNEIEDEEEAPPDTF